MGDASAIPNKVGGMFPRGPRPKTIEGRLVLPKAGALKRPAAAAAAKSAPLKTKPKDADSTPAAKSGPRPADSSLTGKKKKPLTDTSPGKLTSLNFPGVPKGGEAAREIFGCRIYTVAHMSAWRVLPPGERVDKKFSYKTRTARDAWAALAEFVRTFK